MISTQVATESTFFSIDFLLEPWSPHALILPAAQHRQIGPAVNGYGGYQQTKSHVPSGVV
jgi:hypothetical protein